MFAVPRLLIKHEMVLAGDEPLRAAAALHVLVAGALHGPLAVPPGTVADWVCLLQQQPPALLTPDLEGQPALLADHVEHQPVLTEELGGQLALLVTHVEPVALLLVGHEVPVPGWSAGAGGGRGDGLDLQADHQTPHRTQLSEGKHGTTSHSGHRVKLDILVKLS